MKNNAPAHPALVSVLDRGGNSAVSASGVMPDYMKPGAPSAKGGHREEIAIAALLQQLDKRHSLIGHRVLGDCGWPSQIHLNAP
jgi:hypothetical protein